MDALELIITLATSLLQFLTLRMLQVMFLAYILIFIFHYISEWLVDRHHCQSKWQDNALIIREKINEAIQDMPAVDEIMQLLSGSCMYFNVYDRYLHDFVKYSKNDVFLDLSPQYLYL